MSDVNAIVCSMPISVTGDATHSAYMPHTEWFVAIPFDDGHVLVRLPSEGHADTLAGIYNAGLKTTDKGSKP